MSNITDITVLAKSKKPESKNSLAFVTDYTNQTVTAKPPTE